VPPAHHTSSLAFCICNLPFIQLFSNASIYCSLLFSVYFGRLSQHLLDLKDNCGGDKNVQQSYNAHAHLSSVSSSNCCPRLSYPQTSAPLYTPLCRSCQILEGTRGHAESASLCNSSSSSDSELSLYEATRTGCLAFWASGDARMRMASEFFPSCIKETVCF
jgi:hypothetical protein